VSDTPDVAFTSTLSAAHREEVERLLFFNGNQARVAGSIGFVTQRYGMPKLRLDGERLRIGLDPHAPQTLYAVEREDDEEHPIGVIVYVREDDALVALFVAVDESYSSRGDYAAFGLLRRLVAELGTVASRVRGLNSVAVYFGRATPTRIRVVRNRP
jgi:hypothetical protein